jgi:hypothetical protein
MTQSGRLSRALRSRLPCPKRWPALFEIPGGFGVLLGFAHVSGMVQSVTVAVGEDEVAKAALAITMGKLDGSP